MAAWADPTATWADPYTSWTGRVLRRPTLIPMDPTGPTRMGDGLTPMDTGRTMT